MAYTYLDITNEVLARFNEVSLTSANFANSRGFQTQCKNAVNDAINYIFQREFGWSFSHEEQTETLVAGTTRYSIGATIYNVDYETFRISKDDNNYGLYPYPDKAYTLKYDAYVKPTALSAATDVPTIPEQFRQVIVDGATAYGYQYRGEAQQYGINFARFEEGIKHMQSLFINRNYSYVRSTYIPQSQRYGTSVFPTGG
jgi:hypothetical protein